MRFAALALSAVALLMTAQHAHAQSSERGRGRGEQQQQRDEDGQESRTPRIAPLRRSAAAGPCPYVKILYDAARSVEFADNRTTPQTVGFTGEIEGLASDCAYQSDQPITLQTRVLFNLGRGPMAQGDAHTYRYWIAVTERNRAVLAKEYFDLPVQFDGERVVSMTQDQTIVIPRASATISGDNFEVLVGFDVTPEMAEFNASGSRFRVTAGTAPAPAATTPPPVQ